MLGQERDEGKQAEQGRAGAQNGFGRPLTLAFKTQMGTDFLESDFNTPTANDPGQDLKGADVLVGGKESSRGEFAEWVAHQNPTDGQRVMAWGVPQGRAGGNGEYTGDYP